MRCPMPGMVSNRSSASAKGRMRSEISALTRVMPSSSASMWHSCSVRSAALADLHRTGNFLRIGLRGLSVDEVQRMYISLGGQAVPLSRAEAVHQRTEGNPLFVQELLRDLVESGVVVRDDRRHPPAADPAIEAEVPEGLRDVVGKRLSRLSEGTNQLLALASVIGREFRLDVLQRVSSMPDEQLIASLAEAEAQSSTRRTAISVRWHSALRTPFSGRPCMTRFSPRAASAGICKSPRRSK